MARYIRGPAQSGMPLYVETPLYTSDQRSHAPNLTVDEHHAVDTGLVWSTGERILRAPNPIGFGH